MLKQYFAEMMADMSVLDEITIRADLMDEANAYVEEHGEITNFTFEKVGDYMILNVVYRRA